MQSGYYSAAAGMVAQFNRLDTISNNLANVNTIGFKEDNLIVGDFMRLYKEARDELPHENNTKDGASFLNRTITKAPQIVDSYTNFSSGRLEPTNNTFDFALSNEDEFFLVKTPHGLRLTKDGSFTKDDDGKLVTKSGYEVLPDDYFQSAGKSVISFSDTENIIEVDKNGQIYKNIPNTPKLTLGSKFFIAKPDNLKLLIKEGDGLYNYEGISTLKSVEESGGVLQGFAEDSNVNAVKMMTQMIETNRLVGMYQKAMQVQMDDMNGDAINKLAAKA
ncbi:MAG: flagellar hook-basal body protein [Epsilonproteobacteria bacterium]|nr:flagellar hook-basal body protein [Campylobacterota bacterium]